MNRRKAIKMGIWASGLLAIPVWMSNAISNRKGMHEQGLAKPLKIHLGKIEFLIFSDGQMVFDKPQPTFAPSIPKAKFEMEARKLHLSDEVIDLGINIMLIRSEGRTILIDAGMGKHFGDGQGQLLWNLTSAGISPDSITDVLITHAHRDHIGGLVSITGKLNFPHAKYHICKAEYNFWMSENPDFSHSRLSVERIRATIAFTRKILDAIDKNVVLFNPGNTLFSLINTELALGHTPGHTIFSMSSEGKSIQNIVDIFHTPLMISEPEWGVSLDVNFEQGIQTRNKILEDCFVKKTLVMSSHLPWPGLGYIDKRDQYYWSPLNYYTPDEIKL